MLQGPLGQADQAVAPARLARRLNADLQRRDGEAIGLGGEGGLDQVDLGVVILAEGKPRQLVEMSQQGAEGDGAADVGPLRQPEVALGQQQVRGVGHYAVGRLHLGQLRARRRRRWQIERFIDQAHRQQLGSAAALGQAQEEALRQV
ncbi:hypothetical protein D3C79_867910 [compost metagenome]